ncbi:MAG: ABC transporter ATP-binding protein [Syntrophomonadaceae bacterium]|nr:ABC transporter ATP-binding protein [Syntrophomonadaceae bacterium]MDD4549384.1 ABC transporter ATP-binding protein [Syntrophomonadaceae bacterium]
MIRVKDLEKTYYIGTIAVQALRGVSFQLNQGEFVAIMGVSGSGKSTLMNLLGLLDTPTGGTYILDDTEVSALDEREYARVRNQKIGFVFQTFNLLPKLSAQKNVELPMLYAGIKPAERKKRAAAALERLGLGERSHHLPSELSGGQNQRVAIARSLVNDPAILLADEPTGALDSRTSLEIMQIFQELNRTGVAIIMVTHEEHIARHANRILRISDGILIGDEIVEEPNSASQALCSLESGVESR